ncbi:MAG: polyphosphate polymerase domain-containing protein [Clostridia bacterium]|nr:polyphosphate polymerase domain-containing protein [Clostridia bacterium]MBQ1555246.1 polyphosphate polymerase domain-containing protein [Clostridia bacterium]MBQ4397526.1 polyphosphate polymerase domain-containing protein [Clostridia bacterium]
MNSFRHEYKYVIDAAQRQILLIRASGLMQRDVHAVPDGAYLIRSLYFDDDRDTCFYENQSGTDPRSKFRIRYYNDNPAMLRLEKKIKWHGMTRKESCTLTPEEAALLTEGGFPVTVGMSDDKKRLLLEWQRRALRPKVIVTYRRIPFVYPAGNVRVTFDEGITSSDETRRFLTQDYRQRPVLPLGQSILEVKWDGLLPLHIKDMMQLDTLRWSAFSKYYTCRCIHL